MATTYNYLGETLFIYCSHYFSWIKKFCNKHPPKAKTILAQNKLFILAKNFREVKFKFQNSRDFGGFEIIKEPEIYSSGWKG
jgi:hypothetical protein